MVGDGIFAYILVHIIQWKLWKYTVGKYNILSPIMPKVVMI